MLDSLMLMVGLSREVSNILTIQTILGSAKLARDGGKHPGELKDMVTSPGGTTISGLHMLEEGGIRNALMNAVEMATQRSTSHETLGILPKQLLTYQVFESKKDEGHVR